MNIKNQLLQKKIAGLIALIFLSNSITLFSQKQNINMNNNQILNDGIEITTSNTSISNNGTIGSSFSTNTAGNGITVEPLGETVNLGNIINNGIISGYSKEALDNMGNGIILTNSSAIGDITNYGTIQGYLDGASYGGGNGIGSYGKESFSFGNIINNGVIKGTSFSSSSDAGNGIFNVNPLTSQIGNIANYGVISGYSSSVASYVGNGIRSYSDEYGISKLGDITNYGVIKGYSLNSSKQDAGNGILSISEKTSDSSIGNIENYGIIEGNSSSDAATSGNAIIASTKSSNTSSIENITNNGIITGYSSSNKIDTGNGIYSSNTIGTIENNGLIKASNKSISGNFTSLVNNGLMAGEIIVDNPTFIKTGVEIILDSNGNVINIFNGLGGKVVLNDGSEKTIINGTKNGMDSYIVAESLYKDNLINGGGLNKGALIITNTTSTMDSIINGYNTAVYLEDSSQLIAANTLFNGGGLKNDIAVIKGSSGDNSANFSGTSIINGDVDLGDGNDKLMITNTVQINGNLNGGLGKDILNLGEITTIKTTPNLNIFHEINGFENINTNGNITLFETAKITGANNINLENGNLVLRVDPTVTSNGKIIGHALYGNSGTVTSSNGNLVIGLNGVGEGATVSLGGTTIIPNKNNVNDLWWKDGNFILTTNSLVLDGKLSADGKDINITLFESIPLEPSIPIPPVDPPVDPPINPDPPVDPPINPDPPIVIDSLLYEKLNQIYQSIVTAGEIGNLANTTLLEDKTYNESLGGLLTILDQIYANNPYTYTLKSSRDSLKLFEDNLSYLTIKPKKDEVIVQGKAIYSGVKNDNSSSGKNYYGFDTDYRNYKTTTNTVGGLATFEYGLSDKTSIGFVFGGNNQDINFKGSSKIKGNSLYLGTFTKTDINNFKFMSGIGYQYTSADVDRKIANRYNSFATGDKYDINSLNAFVEAKYVYNMEQDWTLEPKVRLSYYYIDQDKVNEGYIPGQISMRTDKADSNTADIEVGVDFIKSLYLNNGKLKNILSLGVINTIGDKSEELNGYILGKEKDGKKFDIQGVELPKTSGKVSYNLELEQTNGMIYTAGISLEFAKDYNRNINATVGMGYKF